jgi:hypothetical protein
MSFTDRLGLRYRDINSDDNDNENNDNNNGKRKYTYDDYDPEDLEPIPIDINERSSLFNRGHNITLRKDCIFCIYRLGNHYTDENIKPYPEITEDQMNVMKETIKNSHMQGCMDEGCMRVYNFYTKSIAEQMNEYLDEEQYQKLPNITPQIVYDHFEYHSPTIEMQILRTYETYNSWLDMIRTTQTPFKKIKGTNSKVGIHDPKVGKFALSLGKLISDLQKQIKDKNF